MIGVPDNVTAAREHLEREALADPDVFGVGLSHDGEEWAVLVILAPGLYGTNRIPHQVNGVRVITGSATELRDIEA